MGDDKWIRRKPGRVSGTVVPPPAGEDLPPLPQRRNQGRPRLRHDGREHGRTRSVAPARPDQPEHFELPDSVRHLFPPVLRARKTQPVRDRNRHPSGQVQPPDAPSTTDRPAGRDGSPEAGQVELPEPGQVGSPEPGRHGSPDAPAVRDRPAMASASGSLPEQPAATRHTWPGIRFGWAGHRLGWAGHWLAAGPGSRRQVMWMVALTVLALLTAAGTTIALVRQPAAGRGPRAGQAETAGMERSLSAAAAARSAAAAWVSREISRSAIIGCDLVMCTDLFKAGVSSSDLLELKSAAPDPLGADVVVVTPVLQSQFGRRLGTEYAPSVLASFGTGRAKVAVRLVAADGAAAYELALRRDLAARRLAGTQLIGNKQVALPATAETELAVGQVDPRLLITLPALAARHPIRVLAFYDRPPGAGSGVPLAGVELSGTDPQAGLSSHAYLRWLTSFLRSQQSVYRAAKVVTTTRHGHPVVSVRFSRPTPVGLLH